MPQFEKPTPYATREMVFRGVSAHVDWRIKCYDIVCDHSCAPDHAAWDQFDLPPGVKIGRLRAPLFHHSFRDFEHFMGKLNRISSVRARESKLKPLWVVALRIWLAPPFYFMKHFLARDHWKLGLYGVAIAGMSAHGRWLRDIKMLEIHLKRRQEQNAKR